MSTTYDSLAYTYSIETNRPRMVITPLRMYNNSGNMLVYVFSINQYFKNHFILRQFLLLIMKNNTTRRNGIFRKE